MIVKRQLLDVPGIAEINTLGGHLKQYEISINTQKLKSIGITISDLFEALEKIMKAPVEVILKRGAMHSLFVG